MNTTTTSKRAPLIAWHYTTGQKVRGITFAGFIQPADKFLAPQERPVAWFSLHPHFELTAAKGLIDPRTGSHRAATIGEMAEMANGVYRFGLPARELLTGEALRLKARIPGATWKSLMSSGLKAGADPHQWFGYVGPVEVGRCTVQRLNLAENVWEAFDLAMF